VLLARGSDRLETVAEELGAEWEQCDVSDRSEVDAVARRIGERYPAVRLLVNNAGIPGRGTFLELDAERIEAVVRTNYLGSVWCTRAFLPLLEAETPADVVNIVSVAGLVAHGASGPYAASKHAQLAFSRGIAPELARRRIRMHAVCPGPVETPGFPQQRLRNGRFAGRLVLRPDEVADAVMDALARNRREVLVPRYLRLAASAQALFPATLSRLMTRQARKS
jgi:short-subunit dehydrogenase